MNHCKRAWLACLVFLMPLACGWRQPPAASPEPADPVTTSDLVIDASVTEVDPDTGLPRMLSGTVSGDLTGSYDETILEVYFDGQGNPVSSYSVSLFTFTGPDEGTLTSTNFTVIQAPIPLLDENGDPVLDEEGNPILIGLQTAASGTLVGGTDAFEAVFGSLQTQSDLLFTGGDQDLGQADVSLTLYTFN